MRWRAVPVMSISVLVWSALFAMSSFAAPKTAADKAERPSLEVEEKAQETADQADRAADNAVRMLDRVIIKSRAKPAEAKTPANDAWLTAKTKLALVADERVKSRLVTIETQNGIVTLSGTVYSDGAKTAATDIAHTVDGIKSVKNALQVVMPPAQETVQEDDEAITNKVTAALKRDPKLKKAEITVQTDAGAVTLIGDTPDLLASAQAAWTAWRIKGVRVVLNELSVKNK
ncbi:MAG: BON domain-containing protein [Nitrospiraceae bacterium]